jgi:hypothetical protein
MFGEKLQTNNIYPPPSKLDPCILYPPQSFLYTRQAAGEHDARLEYIRTPDIYLEVATSITSLGMVLNQRFFSQANGMEYVSFNRKITASNCQF